MKSYTREMFEQDFRDCLKLSLISVVTLSAQTAQKSTEETPKVKRMTELMCAIQKRFIKIIEAEGIDKIFS